MIVNKGITVEELTQAYEGLDPDYPVVSALDGKAKNGKWVPPVYQYTHNHTMSSVTVFGPYCYLEPAYGYSEGNRQRDFYHEHYILGYGDSDYEIGISGKTLDLGYGPKEWRAGGTDEPDIEVGFYFNIEETAENYWKVSVDVSAKTTSFNTSNYPYVPTVDYNVGWHTIPQGAGPMYSSAFTFTVSGSTAISGSFTLPQYTWPLSGMVFFVGVSGNSSTCPYTQVSCFKFSGSTLQEGETPELGKYFRFGSCLGSMTAEGPKLYHVDINSLAGAYVTPIKPHEVGDIAYWNGSEVKFKPYSAWTSSLGQAIAVCVIPTSHASVWGDGKARFVSVSAITSAGTASVTNYPIKSYTKTSITTTLKTYYRVPLWDNTISGSKSTNAFGYMSSDKFTAGTQNVIDTLSYYGTTSNMIVSPYAADGSFYSDYIRTISGNNKLSDFSGKSNTSTLGTLAPASQACKKYSTNGIAAGNWYLPACGELAYIIPRLNVINSALTACGGCTLAGYYWSSTLHSKSYIYFNIVNPNDGYISYSAGEWYVRPFVALE